MKSTDCVEITFSNIGKDRKLTMVLGDIWLQPDYLHLLEKFLLSLIKSVQKGGFLYNRKGIKVRCKRYKAYQPPRIDCQSIIKSSGQQLGDEVRIRCNKLTTKERAYFLKRGLKIIYGKQKRRIQG